VTNCKYVGAPGGRTYFESTSNKDFPFSLKQNSIRDVFCDGGFDFPKNPQMRVISCDGPFIIHFFIIIHFPCGEAFIFLHVVGFSLISIEIYVEDSNTKP